MKRTLIALLLAGCSSSGLIDKQTIEGGPGQDISVALGGFSGVAAPFESAIEDAFTIDIEVSNNSDSDITVTRIGVTTYAGGGPYRIEPSSSGFNETIAEGEDHLFTLNVRGKQVRPLMKGESGEVTVRVVVTLSNGDSYFYSFAVPVLIGGTPT